MGTSRQPTIVIVSSVHDYRMPRRGSIQAVADAFRRNGFRTVFLSVRFSTLSLLKRDPRSFLVARANRLEICNGVECYLWRTPVHPFATGSTVGDAMTAPLHDVCAGWPNSEVDRLFAEADVIMVESGMGVLFLPRIRRLNPRARVIYRASDPLDTIGAHPMLQRRLEASAAYVDHYCLLASGMAPKFRFAADRSFVVPQAVNGADFAEIGSNPYDGEGRNAVCVGSMLFDPSMIRIAAAAFPRVAFHVIGCGANGRFPDNVFVYGEMPFREMLRYVKHADIGLAPYRDAPGAHYLAESSLKLTQFAYLRRPAACPHFAVGGRRHRFGYTPGASQQIERAVQGALDDRFDADEPTPLTWDEMAPRFLRPQDFADTHIPRARFELAVGQPQAA